ncbi:hypothetical protein R1flu_024184 [Riccia fluitans]|uniref:Uncharacterized protein n=1 Tax=Riccia fluitans TaxID=41844 RepID=A0ABD1XUC0_9MARC
MSPQPIRRESAFTAKHDLFTSFQIFLAEETAKGRRNGYPEGESKLALTGSVLEEGKNVKEGGGHLFVPLSVVPAACDYLGILRRACAVESRETGVGRPWEMSPCLLSGRFVEVFE